MPRINTITADELLQRMARGEQMQVIDIREQDEVEAGMIPSALHIPMSEVVERITEINADVEAVIVCRSGRRSQSVCKFLYINGYTNATNMTGGMLAWKGQTAYPKCC